MVHRPHGYGPGYFHGGGHVAHMPNRRRFWRTALGDSMFDNMYFAPPVQKEIIVHQHQPYGLRKHHLIIIFLLVVVCIALFTNLRR